LEPSSWLGIGDVPHSTHLQVEAKLVTREGLLANANWVYEEAVELHLAKGGIVGVAYQITSDLTIWLHLLRPQSESSGSNLPKIMLTCDTGSHEGTNIAGSYIS
jgi:hypothetical protein